MSSRGSGLTHHSEQRTPQAQRSKEANDSDHNSDPSSHYDERCSAGVLAACDEVQRVALHYQVDANCRKGYAYQLCVCVCVCGGGGGDGKLYVGAWHC